MIYDKVMYIIPGFRHKPTYKAYRQLATVVKGAGYVPVMVSIPWSNTTISQNTNLFLQEYKKVSAKKKYIIGFSFGAIIAFLASTKVSVSGLILCSLSPYFQEDITLHKKMIGAVSMKKYLDFSHLHAETLAKKVRAKKICMLYGKKEAKQLIHRVTQTFESLSSPMKYLVSIQNTDHDIGDKKYLSTIHYIATKL